MHEQSRCPTCGAAFAIKRRRTIYCSRACMDARRPKPLAVRFWSKVDRTGPGCWLWQAGRTSYGYGSFREADESLAHRIAYRLAFGAFPPELGVLHRCDNPPCVRPDHLFLGTRGDNNRDRSAKGRSAVGEARAGSGGKLTAPQVMEIRRRHSAGDSQCLIAREYGVSFQSIHAIVRRQHWKHVA